MPTITLPRHKITLAETVSWLAWEQCFSEEEFTAAVAVEDHRRQISWQAEKLNGLQKGQEAQRTKIHKYLESCQQNIDYGESLIKDFEEVSEHRFSWPDDGASDYSNELDLFQKSISDVLLDLWEAAGSEKVKVWGKRKRNKLVDEEKISRRWFWWLQNPPKAYLTHGYIEHRENSAPTEHIWRNVHFEKPEIEALRKERPRSGHGLKASEALKMAVGFGSPFPVQPVEHDPTGVRPLMERLTAGRWHATGWRVTDAGPSKREAVPPDSWNFLIINFANNLASGGGKQFDGLRIFRGSPSPPAKRPGLKGERAPRSDGGQEFTIGEIAVKILATHSSSPPVDLEDVMEWLFEQVEEGKLCPWFGNGPITEEEVDEFWFKYWGDKENKSVAERGNLVLVSTKEMTRFCGNGVFREWATQRGLGVPALFDGKVAPTQEEPPAQPQRRTETQAPPPVPTVSPGGYIPPERPKVIPRGWLFFLDSIERSGQEEIRQRLCDSDLEAFKRSSDGKRHPMPAHRWEDDKLWDFARRTGHVSELVVDPSPLFVKEADAVSALRRGQDAADESPAQSEDAETPKLTQKDRAKGGRRGKWNTALQEVINKVRADIVSNKKRATLSTVKDWFRDNATFDDPHSFNPPIPNCDDLYIDGKKLVWKDRDGRERDAALVSLRRYIDRANQQE